MFCNIEIFQITKLQLINRFIYVGFLQGCSIQHNQMPIASDVQIQQYIVAFLGQTLKRNKLAFKLNKKSHCANYGNDSYMIYGCERVLRCIESPTPANYWPVQHFRSYTFFTPMQHGLYNFAGRTSELYKFRSYANQEKQQHEPGDSDRGKIAAKPECIEQKCETCRKEPKQLINHFQSFQDCRKIHAEEISLDATRL